MSPSSTHHQSWTCEGGLSPPLLLTPHVCSHLDDRHISPLAPPNLLKHTRYVYFWVLPPSLVSTQPTFSWSQLPRERCPASNTALKFLLVRPCHLHRLRPHCFPVHCQVAHALSHCISLTSTFTPFSTNFVATCYIPVTVLSTRHLLKAFNPHNNPIKGYNIFGCIIFCRMEN